MYNKLIKRSEFIFPFHWVFQEALLTYILASWNSTTRNKLLIATEHTSVSQKKKKKKFWFADMNQRAQPQKYPHVESTKGGGASFS